MSEPRQSVADGDDERCPTCGTTDSTDRFALLDEGRSADAGISGCPNPFHDETRQSSVADDAEQLEINHRRGEL